jgi:hypothetical protein
MASVGGALEPGEAAPERRVIALRPLTGHARTAFRLFWWLALASAILSPVIGTWQRHERRADVIHSFAAIGMVGQTNVDGGIRLRAPRTSEARASGIREGDAVLAVDGRAVSQSWADLDRVGAAIRAAPGPVVAITTRSIDGTLREHRLTRSARHDAELYAGSGVTREAAYWFNVAMTLLAVAFMVVAASLLYRRCRGDPVAMLMSLGALLVVHWWAPYATFDWIGLDWLQRLMIGLGWIANTIVFATFPSGRFEPRWTLAVVAASIVWAVVVVGFEIGAGPVANLCHLVINGAALTALVLRYRRLPPGTQKQQVRWVLLGLVAALLFGLLFTVALMLQSYAVEPRHFVWLGMLSSLAVPLCYISSSAGLLVSLLRYRLYDAEAVIGRSAGYAVLTVMLAGTFGASAKAIEWFFESNFDGDAGALPGAIGAGLAVVLITPMHRRIQDWAERRFQKALLHLRRDLPDCVGDLRETAGMGELLDEVLARVEAGTRAVRSAVVVEGETVAARGDGEGDFPLSVPLRIGHQQTDIGTLLVGPRPDGSPVGKDEREALAEIADPIARAIRIVREREGREAFADARAFDSETRIAAIEVALAKLGGAAPGSAPC